MQHAPQSVSHLLANWKVGDPEPLRALVPIVYDELPRAVHRHLRAKKPNHNLQSTALVHEAYFPLARLTPQQGRIVELCFFCGCRNVRDFGNFAGHHKKGHGHDSRMVASGMSRATK